jgi:hypothetical protein
VDSAASGTIKVALSNVYLNSLDQQMPQQEGERERYANEDLHFLRMRWCFCQRIRAPGAMDGGSEISKDGFRSAAGGFGSIENYRI